jgi:hypothetical protein
MIKLAKRSGEMSDEESIQRLTWKWKRIRTRVVDAVFTLEGLRGTYSPPSGVEEIRQIAEELAPLHPERAEEIRRDILLLEGIVQRWLDIYWPSKL